VGSGGQRVGCIGEVVLRHTDSPQWTMGIG
jgi:hypothetical protein